MDTQGRQLTKKGEPMSNFISELSKDAAGVQSDKFFVLKNKTRLRILDLLKKYGGLLCVAEIADVLDEVLRRIHALRAEAQRREDELRARADQRLREKQRLRAQYGIREKQLRIAFEEARRTQGLTGENLVELLEMRLEVLGTDVAPASIRR